MRRAACLTTLITTLSTLTLHAAPPARPEVRADRGRIATSSAECKADTDEVYEDPSGKMAAYLCDLRAQHARAREQLRVKLAELVAAYKDYTNHEHAQRLPATLESLQRMVADCLAAVESQQYCHNIACLTDPEQNAILCETKVAQVADAILGPPAVPYP